MPERDIYDIFRSPPDKDRKISIALALLFHIVIFLINFPPLQERVFVPETVVVLRPLASPPEGLTKTAPEVKKEKTKPRTPKPKEIFIPIPDPTPQEPEIIKKVEEPVSPVVSEIQENIDLGEIKGPPNEGDGKGEKEGSQTGKNGRGPGEGGSHTQGDPGVTSPQLLKFTKPSYTDDAIKARIQGVVTLEAVVRKDGKVDSFKVVRGLGYGLDEKSIEEVAKNWKFRPGLFNGKPVDIFITIEIEFNLH